MWTKKTLLMNVCAIAITIFFWTGIAKCETKPERFKGQSIYVPIYSHIYSGDKEHPLYLAVTVSIRNTDPSSSIRIFGADYYSENGKIIRKYVQEPIELKPFASTRYVIKETDKTGGSGAFLIMSWSCAQEVNPPIVESIMIGTQNQQGLSFTSRGQAIAYD